MQQAIYTQKVNQSLASTKILIFAGILACLVLTAML